jgi:hypothetical protein
MARAVNAAADVIHRAQVNGTQTATGLAIALESAQLLQSPETARELERLRARVADLEAERHSTNEALSDAAEQLRADRDRIAELEAARTGSGGHSHPEAEDVTPQVRKLRALLAGQRAATETDPGRRAAWRMLAEPLEDPHDSPLHHDYRVGRDLPQTGSAQ